MPFIQIGQYGNPLKQGQYLDAKNIRGGTITAQELVISGGTTGVIRSQNYDGSSAGWAIFGDGSASFYGDITIGANAIITGDFYSANWDGAIPISLGSGTDATATEGYAFDSSVGVAQVQELIVGAADSALVMRPYQDFATIIFEVGDTDFEGVLTMGQYDGGSGQTVGNIQLAPPYTSGSSAIAMVIANSDGALGGFINMNAFDYVMFPIGSASAPSIIFDIDTDTGLYQNAANEIAYSFAGNNNFTMRGGSSSAVFEVPVGHFYIDVMEANHDFYLRTDNGSGQKNRIFVDGSADRISFYDHDGSEAMRVQDPEENLVMYANSDGHVAINFAFERAWTIEQEGTGSSTQGKLYSTTNKLFTMGGVSNGDKLWVNSSSTTTSAIAFDNALTNVGNHETLRLDRGSGGTMKYVGYYSSREFDPKTGRRLKDDLIKAQEGKDVLHWIDRVDPTWYKRTDTLEALASVDGKSGWEFGFILEELAETSPYLTTKPGKLVGGSPDELALIAVLWESNRDLRRRVAKLERKIK